ncbi:C40 family peptidase [Paenibacillus sp. MBLB4367]|uniref:C40 family peptidase n=1 Tax=Paenibacillus sp. MBLB4367 TaxID=3384767 RepID=UPI00390816F9
MINIKRRLVQSMATIGLSVTLAVTGTLALAPQSAHAATASAQSLGDKLISYGDNYLGRPYKFGASTSTTASFDCSSFTQHVFKHFGISLPRTSSQQSKVGKYVPKSQLRKGDLVFFSTAGSKGKVAHVGIYAGNGKFLNTYGNPQGVTFSNINSSWWKSHYITARRVY